jgi:hypothetical protein
LFFPSPAACWAAKCKRIENPLTPNSWNSDKTVKMYALKPLSSFRPGAAYGDPAWTVMPETESCDSEPVPKDEPLRIRSDRLGVNQEFLWTYFECLLTPKAQEIFLKAGLTGMALAEVYVGNEPDPSELRRLIPTGTCRLDLNRSVRPGRSKRSDGIFIEEGSWDGSDFFSLSDYPTMTFISERTYDVIRQHSMKPCVVWPMHELPFMTHLSQAGRLERDVRRLIDGGMSRGEGYQYIEKLRKEYGWRP